MLQLQSTARSQLSTRIDISRPSSTPGNHGDLNHTSMLHGARESGLEVRACMYLWTHLHPTTTALPRHARGVRQLHSAPNGSGSDGMLQHSRGSSSVPHTQPAGSVDPSSDPSDSVPALEGGGRAVSPGKVSAAERAAVVLVSSELYGGLPNRLLLASHNPRSKQHLHRSVMTRKTTYLCFIGSVVHCADTAAFGGSDAASHCLGLGKVNEPSLT